MPRITAKRCRSSSPSPASSATPISSSASKKQLLYASALNSGTPFPHWPHPTPLEAQAVVSLLSSVHGLPQRPKVLVDREDAPAGCGQVPSVLDALVRTILSQNTTSRNSTAAKEAMDRVYGRANYRAVLEGGEAKLEETIRCGGLAKNKSKAIVGILKRLDGRNAERGGKVGEGELSLGWLHELSDEEAMKELIAFDLVGIKTAACVLLFCLSRDSFAVDTHVHRITQNLGWLPPSGSVYTASPSLPPSSSSSTPSPSSTPFVAKTRTSRPPTRDQTFHHLDAVLPAALKYPLHSLLVRHGRGCVKCAAKGVTSMDFVETCPIEHLVRGGRGKAGKEKSKGKKEEVKNEEGEIVGEVIAKEEGDGIEFKPLPNAPVEEKKIKEEVQLGKRNDAGTLLEEQEMATVEHEIQQTTRRTRAKRPAAVVDHGDHKPTPIKRTHRTATRPSTVSSVLPRSKPASSRTRSAQKGERSVDRDEVEMGGQPWGDARMLPDGAIHGLDG
ncbi:hypothetical protein JCM21900_005350 [Sporobolomyces salmonicolor]